jgi:hypothetical protein
MYCRAQFFQKLLWARSVPRVIGAGAVGETGAMPACISSTSAAAVFVAPERFSGFRLTNTGRKDWTPHDRPGGRWNCTPPIGSPFSAS